MVPAKFAGSMNLAFAMPHMLSAVSVLLYLLMHAMSRFLNMGIRLAFSERRVTVTESGRAGRLTGAEQRLTRYKQQPLSSPRRRPSPPRAVPLCPFSLLCTPSSPCHPLTVLTTPTFLSKVSLGLKRDFRLDRNILLTTL